MPNSAGGNSQSNPAEDDTLLDTHSRAEVYLLHDMKKISQYLTFSRLMSEQALDIVVLLPSHRILYLLHMDDKPSTSHGARQLLHWPYGDTPPPRRHTYRHCHLILVK